MAEAPVIVELRRLLADARAAADTHREAEAGVRSELTTQLQAERAAARMRREEHQAAFRDVRDKLAAAVELALDVYNGSHGPEWLRLKAKSVLDRNHLVSCDRCSKYRIAGDNCRCHNRPQTANNDTQEKQRKP